MGLLQKLRNSKTIFKTFYNSLIPPHLDYIIYEQPFNNSFQNKIEFKVSNTMHAFPSMVQ